MWTPQDPKQGKHTLAGNGNTKQKNKQKSEYAVMY